MLLYLQTSDSSITDLERRLSLYLSDILINKSRYPKKYKEF